MDWLEGLAAGDWWLLGGLVILAGVLIRVDRSEARTILFMTALFTLSVIGLHLTGGEAPLARQFRGICFYLKGVALVVMAGIVVFRAVLPALRFSTPRILQDLVTAVVLVFWTLYSLETFGLNVMSVVATSAVLTAILGFSLQDSLSNVAGGLALQLDRAVRVGNWIQFDNVQGKVVETNWRYTALETGDWDTVIVPNSMMVRNKFTVLGRRAGQVSYQRRWIWFCVDFRYAPNLVIEAVLGAIGQADIPFVAKDPPPSCLHMEFQESHSRYALRYFLTDIEESTPTDSAVRLRVYLALQRAGMPLSMPAHAVFLTEETEERKASKTSQELETRVRSLKQVDIFGQLPESELSELAIGLLVLPFVTGDVMTRQGEVSDCLYILVEGRADVIVESEERQTKIAEVHAGSCFGEWGLLTGEPRHATVIARTPVLTYRLNKEPFQRLIAERPAIAEELSQLLAKRSTDLDSTLQEEEASARLRSEGLNILGKIRRFFGIGADPTE